jgi:hypothetical protein
MRSVTILRAAAAAFLLQFATVAPAAVQLVNGSGILTGATGVNVSGTLYDVSFLEGSCQSLYSGCDASADFTFQTSANAQTAAQALLDQVFLDTLAGSFDSNPGLTFGCEAGNSILGCSADIAYSGFVGVTYSSKSASNAQLEPLDDVYSASFASASADSSQSPYNVWAIFTLSQIQTAVPEPSTWAMMIMGFGAVGLVMRRRRKDIIVLS